MAVETVLSELSEMLCDYELIRDCVAGQRAIKLKKDKYLPNPDPLDESDAGKARYKAYLDRAVFYGVTGRTLRGLVGLVFDKDPAIQIPKILEPIKVDASGSGMTLDQQANKVLTDVVALGRAGLLADYPVTNKPTTVAEAQAGNIRPTIIRYKPEDIINWRVRKVGAKLVLVLVVLKEQITIEDDGFTERKAIQYRVLRLDPVSGNYIVELWRDFEGGGLAARETFMPTDGSGRPLKEIPFTFVGSLDNDPNIDQPPLLDIAELNKAHYLNSADYEESVFLVGQPTPVFSGLTKQWVDDVFTTTRDDGHGAVKKETKIRLGSRAAVPLPVGGSAELLQAEPNTMAFEAMTHKEAQLIALGAKLIENTGTQQTATEATLDSVLDNSVLAVCARNVSLAYTQCLTWCMLFATGQMIDDEEKIDYELSTDFASQFLTSLDRAEIVNEWVRGAITWEEMRWNLRRAGIAYEDDEVAKEAIASERQTEIAFQAQETAAAGGIPNDPNAPPAKPAPGTPPAKAKAKPAGKPK